MKAKKLISRALGFEPKSGAYLDSYAWVLYRMNKFEDALEYINKAVDIYDDDPVIYVHKAQILTALGRIEDALGNWETAKTLSNDAKLLEIIEKNLTETIQER